MRANKIVHGTRELRKAGIEQTNKRNANKSVTGKHAINYAAQRDRAREWQEQSQVTPVLGHRRFDSHSGLTPIEGTFDSIISGPQMALHHSK